MDRDKTISIKYVVGIIFSLIGVISLSGCSNNSKKEIDLYKTEIKAVPTGDNTNIPSEVEDEKNTLSLLTGEESYPINLNQIGYRLNDKKIAAVNCDDGVDSYQVLDESGNTVFSGKLEGRRWDNVNNRMVKFADFSEFKTPGSYYIICGDDSFSDEFAIREYVYDEFYKSIGDYFSEMKKKADLLSKKNNPDGIKAKLYETGKMIDVTGGWYDLKERGQYVVDSCTTIASLMLMYDNYKKLDLKEDEIAALKPELVLQLVKQELQWLQKLQTREGGVYHKVTTSSHEGELDRLYVFPVSTCATADYAAVMARAYGYYEKSDKKFANSCLTSAQKAWSFLQNNKSNIIFSNPDKVTTAEFSDDDDRDERFWAAMELALTTKRSDYVNYMSEHLDTGFNIGFTWQMVAGYGLFNGLKEGKEIFSTQTYSNIKTIMDTRVKSIQNHVDTKNFQVVYESSVTFQTVISEATTLFLMGSYLKDANLYSHAEVFLDYLMGANPYSENYIGDPQQITSLDMEYIAKMVVLLVGLNEVK